MIDTSADVTSLSPWWRHSAILVMIAGFSVLSLVTVLTYTNAPPIPERATDVTGTVVFTGADIQMGQDGFLKYALMWRGSPAWAQLGAPGHDRDGEVRQTVCAALAGRAEHRICADDEGA